MDAMELDSIVECYADSEMDQFRIDVSENSFNISVSHSRCVSSTEFYENSWNI